MIRIGTRGSALARWQARAIGGLVGQHEVVVISTPGDRREADGDKSRWTSTLERALLDGEIDVAVHSAKDVPGELAEGTELGAIARREDPRDALCGASSLRELAPGARVGTSSLRRVAQLRAIRDDLEIVPIRGNVDTRLRRLRDGDVDALILAYAGLLRLGHMRDVGAMLEEFVPAAGQGALALQTRVGDQQTAEAIGRCNDTRAARCVTAERAVTRRLGASCDSAVGVCAVATVRGLALRAWVGAPDGSHWIADECSGDDATVARELADRLSVAGADELIAGAHA